MGGLRGLCGPSCRFCEANAGFIMSHRPNLINDLNALISDAYGLEPRDYDANSLFEFALERVAEPLTNYVLHSVLECSLYPSLFSMRLIIESLAVGLYADRWFGNAWLGKKLSLARGFEMGRFKRCGGYGNEDGHGLLCSQYSTLGREVNEALSWLRDWLRNNIGAEPMDFIYETYNSLSKPIHAIAMSNGGVLGALITTMLDHIRSKTDIPPMRTIIMPAECEEDDLVILDAIHLYALLTRLSMDMLIYARQSIVKKAGNEELTKIRASIEEAIKRIDEVYNEMGSRYGLRDNK